MTRAVLARCIVVGAVALALAPASAYADSTVTVGPTCTLADAVAYADGASMPACSGTVASGTTTIILPASSTPYLLSGTLSFSGDAVLKGGGASGTIIDGGGSVQVITVATDANVTLSNLTITGGVSGDPSTGCTGSPFHRVCPAESGNSGGGISNLGKLALDHVIVTANSASGGTLPTSGTVVCSTGGCPAVPGESAGNGGNGGGIYNDGQLTIEDSTLSDNHAGSGGDGTDAVSGTGTLASAGQPGGYGGVGGSGGAIYNDGQGLVEISGSSIIDNAAGAGGSAGTGSASTTSQGQGGNPGGAEVGGAGGAIASLGSLTVTNSTIAGNATGAGGDGAAGGSGSGGDQNGSPSAGDDAGDGGGVESAGASTTLTNDTLVDNSAASAGTGPGGAGQGGLGGAVAEVSGGVTQLSFVTVADNDAAGGAGGLGMPFTDTTITEADSIVADNTQDGPDQCSQGVLDDGHNLVFGTDVSTDNSCPGTDADPKLAGLAGNGGPTQTLALAPGSGAIGLVPLNDCSQATDQRGVARPQGGACDAGAYEFAPPAITGFTVEPTSPTTVLVAAQINPNLSAHQTSVAVSDGKSTTTAELIGAGDVPVAFQTTLTGLSAGTRYSVAIVATNADGTTTTAQQSVTTRGYSQIDARIGFVAAFGRASTKFSSLKVTHIPAGGTVEVICRGRSCPFAHRTFKVTRGSANLSSAFKHHELRPHATVEIEITARGYVGEVATYTMRSGRAPSLSRGCLAPGATKPTRCS